MVEVKYRGTHGGQRLVKVLLLLPIVDLERELLDPLLLQSVCLLLHLKVPRHVGLSRNRHFFVRRFVVLSQQHLELHRVFGRLGPLQLLCKIKIVLHDNVVTFKVRR